MHLPIASADPCYWMDIFLPIGVVLSILREYVGDVQLSGPGIKDETDGCHCNGVVREESGICEPGAAIPVRNIAIVSVPL